ncbi:hypothetical protein HK405_005330 [Cladochytrium tenue]|nr:hypothetical protein HK405_005330 [Cladochytrium tenue]
MPTANVTRAVAGAAVAAVAALLAVLAARRMILLLQAPPQATQPSAAEKRRKEGVPKMKGDEGLLLRHLRALGKPANWTLPVLNASAFGMTGVAITGLENVKWATIKNDIKILETAWPSRWKNLAGHDALSMKNEGHTRLYALMSSAISKINVSVYYRLFHDQARRELAKVCAAGQDGRFPVVPSLAADAFTFATICGFAVGDDAAHLAAANALFDDFLVFTGGLSDIFLPEWLYFTPYAKASRAGDRVRRVVKRIVDERRQRIAAGETFGDALGSMLTAVNQDGEGLTEDEIMDNIRLFLFVGYETTSGAIANTIHVLTTILSEKDLADLMAEITAFGGRDPTESEITALPILDGVVRETLRLYPPVRFLFRRATADSEIPAADTNVAAAAVGKGEAVFVGLASTMRDPALFPEPETFSLDRWIVPSSDAGSGRERPANAPAQGRVNPLAFLPFSAGQRKCLGMRLALTEIKVFIFELLRNYEIQAAAKPAKERFFFRRTQQAVELEVSAATMLKPWPTAEANTRSADAPAQGPVNPLAFLPSLAGQRMCLGTPTPVTL